MRRRDLLKTMVAPLFAPLLALVPEQAKAKLYAPSRLHEQDVRGIICGPVEIPVGEVNKLTRFSMEHLARQRPLLEDLPVVPVDRDPGRYLVYDRDDFLDG